MTSSQFNDSSYVSLNNGHDGLKRRHGPDEDMDILCTVVLKLRWCEFIQTLCEEGCCIFRMCNHGIEAMNEI